MSAISAAILATSPFLYWKLDETIGTTATDLGSGAHDGTISGDISLGVTGPEVGTFALRMFPGGQVLSTALGLTGTPNFSMGFYAAVPVGNSSSQVNFMSIGNPVIGSGGRGPLIRTSNSSGVPNSVFFWAPATTSAPVSAPQPFYFWHHFAFTFDSSTAILQTYVDGSPGVAITVPGTRVGMLVTDPLKVESSQNYALAHVNVWSRKLSTAEVASIGSFATQWPYSVPVNEPIPVPDLSSLTAQLDTLTADVASLTTIIDAFNTVTFPSLADVLATIEAQLTTIQTTLAGITFPDLSTLTTTLTNILNGLGTTIQSGASTIAMTFTDLFKQFTVDSLTTLDLSGGATCDPIDINIGGASLFGLVLDCTTVPAWYAATGPGDQYIIQDLAVITIRRGTHILLRKGIHELHTEIYPLPGLAPEFQSIVETIGLPPEYHVRVDWGLGVCGTLGGLEFP